MTHVYRVRGMHCQSCVGKVTAALRQVPGVTAAEVSLDPPQARVETATDVHVEDLNRAAQTAGPYTVEAAAPSATTAPADPPQSLYPLALIVAYILGTVALVALTTGERSPHVLMRHFMGGFFLVFSFFKLLDLRGFANAYRTYDVVAKAWPAWGFAYPFIELALGAAYLADWQPLAANVATLVLMLVGSIGVLQALLAKRTIRCACLGTALNLPMTTITLVEDLAMAAMAAIALATG